MTFYKSLIIIFSTLLISCSKSDELILNAYECEKKEFFLNQEDYLNCSESCKKITLEDENSKNSKVTFGITVDKEGNKVLHRIYKNKEIMQSEVFGNCKIFDKKNWDCSSKESFMNTRTENNIKMNNGIFINHSERRYHTQKSTEVLVNYALCGK